MSDSEATQSKPTETKVDGTTKPKKDVSYTYWVNNDPNFFTNGTSVDIKPKPIQEEEFKRQSSSNDKKDQVSAWNTSGTWEEKSLDLKVVRELIEKALSNAKTSDGKIKFVKVSKLEGEVKIILSRGKKRMGHHLEINVKYKGINELEGASGTLNFTELADDGDYEVEVKPKGDKFTAEGKKSVQQSADTIHKIIFEALKSLKD